MTTIGIPGTGRMALRLASRVADPRHAAALPVVLPAIDGEALSLIVEDEIAPTAPVRSTRLEGVTR